MWFDQRRNHDERLQDALKTLDQRPAGAELKRFCEENVIEFKTGRPNQGNLRGNALGSYDSDKTVTVSIKLTHDEMVGVLAHEMEHVRQTRNRDYKDPARVTPEDFMKNICENEAKAESKANQVTFELAHKEHGSVTGPLYTRLSAEGSDQCRSYVLHRQHGDDHETAAKGSEQAWGNNGIRERYEAGAAREWREANPHRDKRDTKATDGSDRHHEQSRPDWNAKWRPHSEKIGNPDPSPPADKQSQSKGRSR